MSKEFKTILLVIGTVVISFVAGIIVERIFHVDPEPKIKESIKTEVQLVPYAVHDTLTYPEYVEVPSPYPVYMNTPIDTNAIVADYLVKRNYKLDFSSDSLGIYRVDVDVQGNKIVSAISTIQPIIRTVTKETVLYKAKKLQFYGMIGSSVDLKTNKVQFGADFNNKFMLGASGIRLDDNYGYTIDFGIKF